MDSYPSQEQRERLELILLANMRQQAPQLQELFERVNSHWCYEDGMYRFYYQSCKVFERLQGPTQDMTAALTGMAPEGRSLCKFFREIVEAGTGRKFQGDDNDHWVERTAPIVQAFLHARYFLEMAVKYAAQLEKPPQMMPSGWAAMLTLYGIR